MTIRLGVLGLGSVFSGPYASLIQRLMTEGRVELTAAYDVDPEKRKLTADRFGTDPSTATPQQVIESDDVDALLVLTSMNEHGPFAKAGLAAGKHVLVEKPMATSLSEAAELVEAAKTADGKLVCAPHIVLSKTYQEMHTRVQAGEVGRLLLGRARYGWAGPWWGRWFYQPGGGALFDLGVYNLTSLCGFFGPVKRVTAMVGIAIPERMVEGELMKVEADDNAHVVLDFGEGRFASIATGFTMQKYRSPAIELYGSEGVLQMLGRRLGARGVRAVEQRPRFLGGGPRVRPAVALDGRSAPPRRRRGPRPAHRHPSRARLPRARGDAGREAVGSGGSGHLDRERVPRPGLQRVELLG